MRALTYFVATSLDGRIAGPDGDWSAFPTEGDHLDMILASWSDTLPAHVLAALGREPDGTRFDAVLMGWETYAVGLPLGVTSPYPHLEQVVVSRRHGPEDVPTDVRVVGDPLAEVRRLKQQPGAGIWLCGGGALAASVAEEIDRWVLKVNPVVMGDGVPLLHGGGYAPRDLVLTACTPYRSGVVVLEYERA
ncbi:dihydrofolate reductase family protein [Nocardioides nanhaiensis]|uniref:Dihydrofolate reductase family protein n=1 Tax=Nocardioides nanhaiensis TaxID=1476871 RepID=A0ABP8VXE7_9ACTN